MQRTEFRDSSIMVFKMSLPIFIELMLQLLVGNIDQIMISRYSQNAVAAIGNGNQLMNLIIIFLNMMCVATSILISRSLGAHNTQKVAVVCNVSFIVIAVFSSIGTVLAIGFRTDLFRALSIPDEILIETGTYFAIVGAFLVVQGLYANLAAILRSHGLVKEVMTVSLIMNLANIVGNAVLINGLFGAPRLGIKGAAIATDISKVIGLVLMFVAFRKNIPVRLSTEYLRPFPFEVMREILGIGLPSGAQQASYSLSEVFILRMVNTFGTAIIATRVYCNILTQFAFVYVMAISSATQILIGYLIGSAQYDRINARIIKTVGISIAVSVGLTGVLYGFSDQLFSIFTQDSEILVLGKQIIFIEFFLEVGRAINIVLTKTLVAAGDVMFSVWVGVFFGWIIAVMGGYLLGVHWGYGLIGIWMAKAIDELVRAGVLLLRLKSSAWRKKISDNSVTA